MATREWQVGIVGTFDVENFGDLLFPLLAEHELGERLGAVRLHRFSYNARSVSAWPFAVTSVAELPRLMPDLDGLLVGGGYLIRFDKEVAPGYGPPSPAIHHPTGYWLTPGLIALQHGVPLIWNAPGMHCNELPTWAEPLLRLVLSQSAYVAVRDEATRAALAPLAAGASVLAVPDTGFALARTLAARTGLADELARFRSDLGLEGPYLVVQAATGTTPFLRFLERHGDRLGDLAILALPIAPALTEDAVIVREVLPHSLAPRQWPHPLLLAEVIRHAEAVAGHSYHLAISALTAGVPVFSSSGRSGKYSAFTGIASIYPMPGSNEEREAADADFDLFRSRLARTAPPIAIAQSAARVATHWDRVAAALRDGQGHRARRASGAEAVGRFLQTLPGLLEGAIGSDRSRDAVEMPLPPRPPIPASP